MGASGNVRRYTVNNRLYRWHIEQFLKELGRLVAATQSHTLLDVGCGEGFVVAFLKTQLPETDIVGIDLSETVLACAREHFGHLAAFRQANIYQLPFLDTVVCTEVLEHLHDPDRAVCELKRVARRDVVITVPLEPYFKWLNRLGQWLSVSGDPGHVQFWDRDGFEAFIHHHFPEAVITRKHIYQLARGRIESIAED